MAKQHIHPAKLLLFGEYSIIKGSQALAIPLDKYNGHWAYGLPEEQLALIQLVEYLEALDRQNGLVFQLDFPSLKKDLNKNLIFQSSIPQGYGVGSSGALCAAIYRRFGKHQEKTAKDLWHLKNGFAQIESYFHGASSGIDPLVCYLHQAILIKSKSSIQTIALPKAEALAKHTIFLLDTEIPRETEPLVKLFLKQCENLYYENQLRQTFIPLVDQAIDSFLAAKPETLFELFHKISQFQIEAFSAMIPRAFQGIWQEGLDSDTYKLKLCGAGGGGFILGISKDFEKTKVLLSDYPLSAIING